MGVRSIYNGLDTVSQEDREFQNWSLKIYHNFRRKGRDGGKRRNGENKFWKEYHYRPL